MSAARPATCGAAIEVPLFEVAPFVVLNAAATMLTPGAVTSGFSSSRQSASPSLLRGPVLEKGAITSSARFWVFWSSEAATVTARVDAAGVLRPALGKRLPAAA